ncbi:MAG TPA: hypothetical protein VFM18_05235 [Methanosarcina sp.]|nr:hypothetical protein [Methanosarcina sp.]
MNKVASILRDRASEIRKSSPELVAVDLLKQAGLSEEDARLSVLQQSMEKTAAAELTYKGIDHEEAARLVKAANINVKELQGIVLETEEEGLANVLEKAAAFIEAQDEAIQSLQEQVANLEKVASDANAAVALAEADRDEVPDAITKLASVGALTFEDIEALKAVPVETLTKVASVMDQPWEMGKAAGASAQAAIDPIAAFCLS